jgi:L-lactate dehydrogenase complex protein LldG
MSARSNILGRLRGTATVATPQPDVGNWYTTHQRNEGASQRIARLRSVLESVHTEVHATTDTDWPDLLLKIAEAKGLRNLLIGDNTLHGATLEARNPQNLKLVRYDSPIEFCRNRLFDEIDASLTLARSAIAETGTLILWPSAAEPRLMSLVPPLHFVLLDTTTIHADFYSAIAAEGWKDRLPTNALLISGPSKTADIQQVLAYGAHGPRELVVLLCHPRGESA